MKRSVVATVLFAVLVSAGPAAGKAIPGQYIVVLKDGVSEPAAAADQARRGARVHEHYHHALNGYAAQLSDEALASVRSDPKVEFVAPNRHFRIPRDVHKTRPVAQVVPQGCQQVIPFQTARIGGLVSSAISANCRGQVDANVAVLDTGVDPTHPDLNVVGGINCTGDGGGSEDVHFHGTFVAGTLAARDDFGESIVGIAPGARLWSVRIFEANTEENTLAQTLCGIDWVTRTHFDRDRRNDIDVANMSFGDPGTDDGHCGRSNHDPLHLAICRMTAAGVVGVVAAGNETVDAATMTPAAYDEVLTVTSIADNDGEPGGLSSGSSFNDCQDPNPDDSFSDFSNFATGGDRAHVVAAVGQCVLSAFPTSECGPPGTPCFGVGGGTSFAAPLVSGTVALCIAYNKCKHLSAAQIKDKIVRDAAAYNWGHRDYGFVGDPFRPAPGRYYGYLIRAGIY